MAAMNKANARQSKKREGYYLRQKDVTEVNKTLTMAKHIHRYMDRKQFDRLRQVNSSILRRAADKAARAGVAYGVRETLLNAASK